MKTLKPIYAAAALLVLPASGYGHIQNRPATPSSHPTQAATSITSAAFSLNGAVLAAGGHRVVRLLDAATGQVLATLQGHAGAVTALSFSPDGKTLAAAGGRAGTPGEIRLWDLSGLKASAASVAKQKPQVLTGPADAIYAVAFSPDGRRLAAASYDHSITVWTVNPKANVQNPKSSTLSDHTDAVYALAFSPDGALLASAAGDRAVKVWDAKTSKRLYTLSEATAEVYAVAFSPDGRQLAAGGEDKAIRTYTVSRSAGKLLKTAFAHQGAVLRLAYAGAGALVTSGEDMLVKQWDATTLQEKSVFPKQPDWPSALAVSPQGLIAVGTHNGALTLYDRAGRLVRRPLPGQAIAAKTDRLDKVPSTSAIPGRRLGDQRQRRAPGTGGATLFQASLGSVSPLGMVRGSTVRLTLTGGLISDALGVYFDDPAITGKIVTPADANRGILRVDATIGTNARVGIHRCWVQTPAGTTGSVPFAVGAWPEVAQTEPNNAAENAQGITFPCTVVGALDQPGDVDTFGFRARAGQEIVFEVLGQPLRSRIDPILVVMDEEGKTLAESRRQIGRADTVLGYHFQKGGAYRVQLRDFEGAGGGDVHYRLNVGEFPLITDAFPLGIQKGQTAEVAVKGFNLGTPTIRVTAPSETSWGRAMEIPIHGGVGIARRIAVGADPEVVADSGNEVLERAQMVTTPVSINGRLTATRNSELGTQNSELSHFYRFRARKGERLIVDVQARRLGSPLDSQIEILDSKGAKIERAVLRVVSQTDITFSDRDSASTGLRLTAWDHLQMNDYVQVGREVMRLDRLPKGPDEDVFFRSFRGQRLAYFGTTPEFHTVGAPVYKVEIHPPGSRFSPNGYPLTRLTYQNDDGGPLFGKDSHLDFTAPEDGEYVVRVSDTRGIYGAEFTYRLLIHPPRPDYRLTMSPEHPNIPKGGGAVVTVECERHDGFTGPIEVTLTGLPAGVTATPALIQEGENSAVILLSASPDARTPDSYSEPIRVVGRAKIDGREVVRTIEPDNGARLVTVLAGPDIKVATDRTDVVIRPGETTVVEARVDRQGSFGARVPIDVRNLPYGVWVEDVGLNGVLVTEEQDARKFSIYCEPWVKPQTRPFYVVGNVEGGTPNAAPPLTLRVEAPRPKSALKWAKKRPANVSRR